MIKRALPLLALVSFLASTNMTAHAQSKGDQALLDVLVRKGVLTEKEAEGITADLAKEAASAPMSKIQVGDWVKELKLSGDLRIRNQWDERDPMLLTNRKLGPQDPHIQRDRWRFRLRLNADFKLAGNFLAASSFQRVITALLIPRMRLTRVDMISTTSIFPARSLVGI